MDGRCKSIAFLLGAGFSAPAGLPTANTLNNIIQSKIYARIRNSFRSGISHSPTMYDFILEKVLLESDECGAFNYEQYFDFLAREKTLILDKNHFLSYIEKGMYYFFWKRSSINDQDSEQHKAHILNIFDSEIKRNESYAKTVENAEREYQRIIAESICSNTKKGKIECFNPLYKGFVNIISSFVDQGYNIDIFTLNHDLFLESLLSTTELNDKVCNGFGGEIGEIEGIRYKTFDLQYYDKQIRIYKLHGSLDVYRLNSNMPKYIQMIDGYDYENGGAMNNHEITSILPLFLTGKCSKNTKCAEEPYKSMLKEFENNVGKAEKLIVIGYSGKDKHINDILFNQGIKRNGILVVDPNANKHPFVEKKQAIAFSKSVELLSVNDICVS